MCGEAAAGFVLPPRPPRLVIARADATCYSIVETQLRSVPPYIVSAAWALLMSYFAWKTQRHGLFIAASTSLSVGELALLLPQHSKVSDTDLRGPVVGYIMFIASSNPQVLYGTPKRFTPVALACADLPHSP